MISTVDNILEGVIAKTIDKQDALQNFSAMSEDDKQFVVNRLRSELQRDGQVATRPLKSIHEMAIGQAQLDFIEQLSDKLARRAPGSRANAVKHQAYFVDQRKTAGLKKSTKAMQFQLTYERAEGAYVYDIDGNRYIDIAGDNGVNLFGHQPEFLKKALTERIERGFPLVAYSEELFAAAKQFCELTGHQRMVFTQSGTEAVMWAVRIARAATGKKKILICDGSYHGLSDAVLAFRDRKGNSVSAGLGMLQEFAEQLVIVEYGADSALEYAEAHSNDIACVLIEPVQSRFPDRQPGEFLAEMRKLTLENNVVLIFDEMITGFRAGPRGAAGYFGVKPDIATYGKVAGGGMPTGIIAGFSKYLNYCDGGAYGLDDQSMPSLRRTMMAGTHTQNPLKVAATLAVCEQLKSLCKNNGDCCYADCRCELSAMNAKTEHLANQLNDFFSELRVPIRVEYFSSLFRFQVLDDPFGLVREVFIALLRSAGVETSTSGNCFLNLAHSDDDVREVEEAVKQSILALLENQFFIEPDADEVHQPAAESVLPARPVTTAINATKRDREQQLDRLKVLLKNDLQSATQSLS